jgi:choline dehydrogenase-like flavoprotein
MATTLQNVDVVIVGVGWCGSILAKELSQNGLKVVGLERGGYRPASLTGNCPARMTSSNIVGDLSCSRIFPVVR